MSDISNLEKIDEDVIRELLEDPRFSDLKSNYSVNKTWKEIGFDELDLIEFLMAIEIKLGIVISDDIAMEYFEPSNRPIDFPGLKVHKRDKKINILLN